MSGLAPDAVGAIVLAFLVSAALIAMLVRGWVPGLQLLDEPNARSLHQRPVPRSGGFAVVGGILVGAGCLALLVAAEPAMLWLGAALLLVTGVSYLDDRRDLSPRLRLLVHLMAALLLWLGGLRWEMLGLPGLDLPLPLALALPLSFLYIVWMINLYNFMDGMDGLAGGMAVLGFGALGLLGVIGGDVLYASLCGVVAAAAAGFLTGNFPPARIFLGDMGSSALGLLAAGLSLWGASAGLFGFWVACLAFSPFIVDATWTLARRALRRERLWEAHRSHHYQRLVLAGWGHRRTLTRALLLMAAVAASAVAAPRLSIAEQWQLLAGWVVIYGLVHLRVGIAERAAGL